MVGDCGSTCPASDGFHSYDPSIGGNTVLLVAFALLALAALYIGFRSQTYLFSSTLTIGLLVEVLGFIGRILLHSSRDSQGDFFLFLFGTVLGPSIISLAIFIVLPNIVGGYGESTRPFKPLVAGLVFWGLSAITLMVELIGIVFTAYESNGVSRRRGATITAIGLGIQTASFLAFSGLHIWITLGMRSRRGGLDARHSGEYSTSKLKKFFMAMEIAIALLTVYSIYRIVEFAGGVSGSLFQNETALMVIGGTLPLLAGMLLVVFYPGTALADTWAPASSQDIKCHRRPDPIQSLSPSGHFVHHLYDPDIRKQISPTSQKHHSGTSEGPPELPPGSMGLPSNPKVTSKPSSPQSMSAPRRGPPAPLDLSHLSGIGGGVRRDTRGPAPKDLVHAEELW
ncbi:hypothetical protein FZEAL_10697 [Fusarium zealandicum]|uniref:Sphingoid long-chain base transporter RSB1 n=1 Tax=Fusarium zealandicum TaxID=1053134 RepID=A0A8H4TXQ0_9HYPO|nr:hypothetical protein FZEAL_10697 [Fusarium zealandicum]